MAFSEMDLTQNTGDNPPAKPSAWLSEVANLSFFLCYDSASMKYDHKVKKSGAFEKLSPEKQGRLCAKAMDELIANGYAKTHTDKVLEMSIEQHERYDNNSALRPFWSYGQE